jgi:hypothetical protein
VKAHCVAWRTVERAKSKLGIRATRKGFGEDGVWRWEMPETFHRPPHCSIDRQQDRSAAYARNGGLCEKSTDADCKSPVDQEGTEHFMRAESSGMEALHDSQDKILR